MKRSILMKRFWKKIQKNAQSKKDQNLKAKRQKKKSLFFFYLEIMQTIILSFVFNRLRKCVDLLGMILENWKIVLDERCNRVQKSTLIQCEISTEINPATKNQTRCSSRFQLGRLELKLSDFINPSHTHTHTQKCFSAKGLAAKVA